MIDEARDLYGLAPSEFVAARNGVAKQLRAAGRADDAAIVAGLRRPKVAEFALNRLARDDTALVERLLAASVAAQHAQDSAIGGRGADLRQATSELRRCLAAAADAAVRLATAHGASGEGQRDEITDLLRAVVTADPSLLRHGLLGSEAMQAPEEFFSGAPEPQMTAPKAPAKQRREQLAARARLERAVREATTKTADLAAAIDDLQRDIDQRTRRLDALRGQQAEADKRATTVQAELEAHLLGSD